MDSVCQTIPLLFMVLGYHAVSKIRLGHLTSYTLVNCVYIYIYIYIYIIVIQCGVSKAYYDEGFLSSYIQD